MTSVKTQQQNSRERQRDKLYAANVLPDYEAIQARVAEESHHCPYCEALVHPDNWAAHMMARHAEEWDGTLPMRVTVADVIGQDTSPFDYDAIPGDLRDFVIERTGLIKSAAKRVAEDTVAIGRYLTEVKDKLPHGLWLSWLRDEVNTSVDTAQRLMRVYREFKNRNLRDLQIDLSALYALSAGTVSEETREQAIDTARETGKLTHQQAKQIIRDAQAAVFRSKYHVIGQLLATGAVTLDQAQALDQAVNDLSPKLRGLICAYLAEHGVVPVDLIPKIADVLSRPQSYLYREVQTGWINGQPVSKANLTDWAAIVEAARWEHMADRDECERLEALENGLPVKPPPVPVTIYPGNWPKTLAALRAGLSPHYEGDTDWLAWLAGKMMGV